MKLLPLAIPFPFAALGFSFAALAAIRLRRFLPKTGARSRDLLFYLLLMTQSLPAGVLFQNGSGPNGNSHDITFSRLADDFVLPQTSTLRNLHFDFFANNSTDLIKLSWAIYGLNGGEIGSILFSGTGDVFVTPGALYDSAHLPLPNIVLGPGQYWLELHAGDSLTSDNGGAFVAWASTADNNTERAVQSSSGLNPPNLGIFQQPGMEQYSFRLTDDVNSPSSVPEPSSALLLASAGAALWLVRRPR